MDEKKLTIYFTSDLHGYIYPTDYRGQGEKELGLFKCASRFRKDGNTPRPSTAAYRQGSPLGAFCHDTIGSAARFAEMMNRCGYDYVTLGNHDFTHGMPYLDSYLNVLKARCVCENVRWDEAGVRFPARIHTLENGLAGRHHRHRDRLCEHLGKAGAPRRHCDHRPDPRRGRRAGKAA